MEQIRPQSFRHNLDKVLKSYQTVAMSSLGGPSSYSARWHAASSEALAIARKLAGLESAAPCMPSPAVVADTCMVAAETHLALGKPSETNTQPPKKSAAKYLEFDPLLHPPPFPIQQMPVFTPIDQSSGEKCETVLENETISCFIVGGEKRLCLPQILNSVLRDFSLQQINAICEDLHIYCSRCSPEQLDILKMTGILPASAPSCGLITKTDAERLCNALLYGLTETKYMVPSPQNQNKRRNSLLQRENCFSVYHECFGKCKGTFIPDLYVSPHAPSIECAECQYVFTPQKFVMHSHKGKENRTCHWGFDSANWRSYLLVAKEQETDEKHQAALADMKAKFDFMSRFKRKHGFDENGNTKKIKVEEDLYSKDAIITSAWSSDGVPLHVQRPSAFRPWSPSALAKDNKALPEHGTVLVRDSRGIPTYLSMGPPVLLNPERVVPHTAASNYDSHYAPNVTLAPPSKPETPNKSDSTESKESSSDSPESRGSPNCRKSWDEDGLTDTTMEQEIEIVRGMLEGDSVSTRAGRDKLLHELARIRMQQEERLQSALAAKKDIQQELDFVRAAKKEKLREAAETKRSLRKENERLRSEYERRLRDMNDSKQHLRNELESLRSSRGGRGPHDVGKDRARLRAENEYMRERLNAVETERDDLQRQLLELRGGEQSPRREGVPNETRKIEETECRNSVPETRSPDNYSPKSSPKTGTCA